MDVQDPALVIMTWATGAPQAHTLLGGSRLAVLADGLLRHCSVEVKLHPAGTGAAQIVSCLQELAQNELRGAC